MRNIKDGYVFRTSKHGTGYHLDVFIPSRSFKGAKDGYVFRTYEGGTGYFIDTVATQDFEKQHLNKTALSSQQTEAIPRVRTRSSTSTAASALSRLLAQQASEDSESGGQEVVPLTAMSSQSNEQVRKSKRILAQRASKESESDGSELLAPDNIGSGVSKGIANKKRSLIEHCNEDVNIRLRQSKKHGVGVFAIKDLHDGVNLVKTIPGVEKNETVVLTRVEIETQIIDDEVKKYIYDLFEPTKHKTNHMRILFIFQRKD